MKRNPRDVLADAIGGLLAGGASPAPSGPGAPILPVTQAEPVAPAWGARADLSSGLRAAEARAARARDALALARREVEAADEAFRAAQTAASGTGFHYTT